jgi:seryl-tRNA synthetase
MMYLGVAGYFLRILAKLFRHDDGDSKFRTIITSNRHLPPIHHQKKQLVLSMNRAPCLRRAIRPLQQQLHLSSTQSTSILKPPHINFSGIVENEERVRQNCLARKLPNVAATIPEIIRLNEKRLEYIRTLSPLEFRRNVISAELGKMKDPVQRKSLLAEAANLKTKITTLKAEQDETVTALTSLAAAIPNDTHPETASTETEVGKIGELREKTTIKDHVEIAESLDILDLRAGARTTGHAWYYLKGLGAQLELALVSYAVEMAIKRGWKLVKPPDVVRTEVALACGFRPHDEEGDQIYQLANVSVNETGSHAESGSLCLAGTAEIPLAAMNIEKIFKEDELPVKYVGVGTAYRAEAESRGKESKGLYRVHQFTKVELFAWTRTEDSDAMLTEILELQKEIVEGLGLHARILDMPPHELGNAAYHKYDIEAWMHGRQGWGEITSASNCTDFQSRRLNTRYRPNEKDAKIQFVHTLNGTAMAVPRMIVAILESGVREDGSVEIPMALRKFLGVDCIR